MTSLVPTPTTALAVSPATVTVMVTQGGINTHSIEFMKSLFIDSYWCATCWTCLIIFMSTILVILILGSFNRLVAIPFFASFAGIVGNVLYWYGWVGTQYFPTHSRRFFVLFANAATMWQDGLLPLYSFFLLERILQGKERRFFLIVFSFVWLALLPVRFWNLEVFDRYFRFPTEEEDRKTLALVDKIAKAKLVTLVSLELFAGYFLLKVFYTARQRTKAMGYGGTRRHLFTQLARSSEVRVATVVVIGILRLICYRSYNTNLVNKSLDRFAGTLNNTFPILFLLDLLASKMIKLQAAVQGRNVGVSQVSPEASRGTEKAAILDAVDAVDALTGSVLSSQSRASNSHFASGGQSGGHRGPMTVDSICNDRDYHVYMGKGWARGLSVAMEPPELISEACEPLPPPVVAHDLEKGRS